VEIVGKDEVERQTPALPRQDQMVGACLARGCELLVEPTK